MKFDNGEWEFGYAAGLNYVFFKSAGPEDEENKKSEHAKTTWDLEKMTLGLEFYGGLGNSELGLKAAPSKTQQYVGINLRSDFANEVHFGMGGAFGLTEHSGMPSCV